MNIIDAAIILLLALGGIIGFKKGFITKITSFLGIFVIIVVAFSLKNPLSILLYENLPFFRFGGFIKGIDVLNILLYELIAFVLVVLVLFFLLRIILLLTGLVEKLLKMTIFLSIPSKILGIVVGILEAYVYIFIGLVILTIPAFNIDIINDSKGKDIILNQTPILSPIAEKMMDTYSEVYEILDQTEGKKNYEINEEILVILLDNKIITVESAQKLIERNKIEIRNKTILDDYQKGEI